MSNTSRIAFPDGPQPRVCLGAAVRDRRAELGLTQADLVARSGLDARLVGDVDRGHRDVHFPVLFRLARALDTTPMALIGTVHQALLDENGWYHDFARLPPGDP